MKLKMSRFKVMALVLAVCLAVSVAFNIYQFLNDGGYGGCETSETRTFVWIGKKYIRDDGVVRVKATFDCSGSNLTMVIHVNDDDYILPDYIGLVFDKDKDGDLFDEVAYLLYAGNKIPPEPSGNWLEEWGGIRISPVLLPPEPSPYHNCTFAEDGYTFNIGIPKTEINFTKPMLTHLCFYDDDAFFDASWNFTRQEANEKAVVWVEFEV
jgi:hypothetical protein